MRATSTQPHSWVKHIDFIVIDLLVLAGAFVCAYWMKFGNLSFVDSSSWKALFVMLLLADLVVTLLISPYSGVFRRGYWEDKEAEKAAGNIALFEVLTAGTY